MPESKPHLLLLHGALGSEKQFIKIKNRLHENYLVHTLNFSGHGGKAIPSKGFSLSLFMDDVVGCMEENKIDSVHIFGYSMGGYVGMALAGTHPEKVKTLMTLATKFDWSPQTAAAEVRMLDPDVILNKVPDFANQLRERHAPSDWKKVLQLTADFMIQLGEQHAGYDFFNHIECPVRLCVGDKDKMVSISETQNMFSRMKNGSVVILPDTPHPFELVNEDRLMNEIKLFCID